MLAHDRQLPTLKITNIIISFHIILRASPVRPCPHAIKEPLGDLERIAGAKEARKTLQES